MKNKNIRKRLWCLLAACVSFVPSSKAMKTETSVDSSGYEASDEASGDDYKDFVSGKVRRRKKSLERKKFLFRRQKKGSKDQHFWSYYLGLISWI